MKSLAELQRGLSAVRTSSRALTEEALARIFDTSGEGRRTFIRVFDRQARAAADSSDRLRSLGIVASPLAGIPVSVKGLTDVAGFTTLAGSVVREGEPAAARDAPVLARLRAAGAIVAPTIASVEEQAEWDRVGRLLLRNSLVGNFLDRCAITVACHIPGEAPVGLMVMGETMADRRLFGIGLGVEQALNSHRV